MNRVAVVAIAGLALGGFAARAQAAHSIRHEVVKAHIPFAFHVEEATLPAGDYVIREIDQFDPYQLEIRSVKTGQAAIFIAEGDLPRPGIGTPSLVFDRVGHDRYLHALWVGNTAGGVLPRTEQEIHQVRHVASRTAVPSAAMASMRQP